MSDVIERLGGLGIPSESAALIAQAPSVIPFGDGSDGDHTIATATTLQLTRDMFYSNLYFTDALSILEPQGYKIFVRNTIRNLVSAAGTIRCNGAAGVADAAGVGGLAGTMGAGAIGGAGQQGAGSAGTASTPTIGGSGGIAGVGVSAAGAAGTATAPLGGATQPKNGLTALTGFCIKSDGTWARLLGGAGGGGGGGDNAAKKGGGGGGGAGCVLVAARVWDFNGTVQAKGGAGADGDSTGALATGGGGGGGGGSALVITRDELRPPVFDVTGGAGGAKGPAAGTAGTVGVTGTYVKAIV